MLSLVTPVYDTAGMSYDQMLELLNAGRITRQQVLDELVNQRTAEPLQVEIIGGGATGFNWLAVGLITGAFLLIASMSHAKRH